MSLSGCPMESHRSKLSYRVLSKCAALWEELSQAVQVLMPSANTWSTTSSWLNRGWRSFTRDDNVTVTSEIQECIPVGCVPPASVSVSTTLCLDLGRGGPGEMTASGWGDVCLWVRRVGSASGSGRVSTTHPSPLNHLPPHNGQKNTCENITLPQTLRAVKIFKLIEVRLLKSLNYVQIPFKSDFWKLNKGVKDSLLFLPWIRMDFLSSVRWHLYSLRKCESDAANACYVWLCMLSSWRV